MATQKKCIENYLSALLDHCAPDKHSSILDGIISFAKALSTDQNVWLFLNSPLMSSVEKNGFLVNFANKLNADEKVLNLFSLLVKNKRLPLLNELVKNCKEKKDNINSINNVELISSQEFSEDQQKQLVKKLESMGFSNINISSKVDSSMVFGFKLLTDNKVYDLSLDSIFEEFKENIARN